jgi:hypothetical protein
MSLADNDFKESKMKLDKNSTFVKASIEVGLFVGMDNDSCPLDRNYDADDLGDGVIDAIIKSVQPFYDAVKEELPELLEEKERQLAHDLWYTRGGHGVGFWDNERFPEHSARLCELAKALPDCCLYLGDDGCIYFWDS